MKTHSVLCRKYTQKKVSDSLISRLIYSIEEGKDEYELVDARDKGSYDKGHPYGFSNLVFNSFLTEDKASFRNKEDLQRIFEDNNLDTKKKLIFSCGGGIVACVNEVAARLAGATNTAVYDGSLQEYSKFGAPDFEQENWQEKYTI